MPDAVANARRLRAWRPTMSIDALREMLPAYAKDLSLNLSTLAGETTLSEQQKWGAFVAAAYAVGQPDTVREINAAAEAFGLSNEAMTAARAAAAIMGMNNVYYRSLHLISNPEYRTLPARLRMNVIGNPGVEKADFELWALAVSAINGCGKCIDSHDQVLRQAGVTREAIQQAVRIASVIHAVAATLDGEAGIQSAGIENSGIAA